jgi:hypothetical protein
VAKPVLKKRTAPGRSTPRVTEDEGPHQPSRKSAAHNEGPSTKPSTQAVLSLLDGELYVSAQLSETSPVAQFAGVTIGPVTLAYKIGGVQMEKLMGVEWPDDMDDEVELTEEQAEVYDRVFAAVQNPLRVLEAVVSTDRTSVERAVRQHNQREEEQKEQKAQAKKPTGKKVKPRIGRK